MTKNASSYQEADKDVNHNIEVVIEKTPHPQALKFAFSRKMVEHSLEISSLEQATRSPLAQKILGFPWVEKVFIGLNFITVTKEDWVEWDIVSSPLCALIKEHVKNGEAILHSFKASDLANNDFTKNNTKDKTEAYDEPASKTVQKIKQILEKDIQPAVAQDGGFIAFAGYEQGKVFLKMQGACSGCPSASLTLKQGIENHLKNQLSEVKEVVAV